MAGLLMAGKLLPVNALDLTGFKNLSGLRPRESFDF
jgi:hypothetical protein